MFNCLTMKRFLQRATATTRRLAFACFLAHEKGHLRREKPVTLWKDETDKVREGYSTTKIEEKTPRQKENYEPTDPDTKNAPENDVSGDCESSVSAGEESEDEGSENEESVQSMHEMLFDWHKDEPVPSTDEEDSFGLESREIFLYEDELCVKVWRPDRCPAHLEGDRCKISKHQKKTERVRCFDVALPFTGVLQRYKCTRHNKTFRITDPKIIPLVGNRAASGSYVIFPHTVVTKAFLLHVVGLYNETFNFAKTARLVQHIWLSSVYSVISQREKENTDVEALAKKLLPSFTLSEAFIHDLIAVWWERHPEGRKQYLEHLNFLRRTTGVVLRIDHTYKIVKCIGVQQDKKWLRLRGSLFSVLNENGLVLASKIVPDDTREHVCVLLREVLKTPNRSINTKVIYTDDVAKDTGPIEEMFRALRLQPCGICQDIWHAEHRIIDTLPRFHPCYAKATSELKKIFHNCAVPGAYRLPGDFVAAVNGWTKKWSKIPDEYGLSQEGILRKVGSKLLEKNFKAEQFKEHHLAPIVSPTTKKAAANICAVKVSKSLWATAKYSEYKAGTNMNESFHKNLSLLASPKSGKEGLHMKKMQVEIAIYRYNTRGRTLTEVFKEQMHKAIRERKKPTILYHTKESVAEPQTYEQIRADGFSLKRGTSGWSEEEQQKLRTFFKCLLENKITMKHQNKYTYVSRVILSGSKTDGEVRSYVLSLFREQRKEAEAKKAEKSEDSL